MRRTIAGTAVSLVAALAISGPLAPAGHTAPTTLQCAGATSTECVLLDQLTAQLGPIAPLLGTALAPLSGQAEGLAARSDQPAGVPTAEVVQVSQALLDQLEALPAPIQTLVGITKLGEVTDTLEALVAELTAPVAGGSEPTGGSTSAPARSAAPTAPTDAAGFGGPTSLGSSASTGGSTSSDAVPDVPVGDPLALAPLALPDFAFDPSFAPNAADAAAVDVVPAAGLDDPFGHEGRGAELVVVAVLSALLLGAAGIAQLQANRHTIKD